ncbi:hypothetical protein MTR67_023913, partial [Solanum verrucosum]
NSCLQRKSHHIRRRHNIVRQQLSNRIITIDYVKARDNMSDPLTKGLVREAVERSTKGMGLRLRTSHHGNNSTSRLEIPRGSSLRRKHKL